MNKLTLIEGTNKPKPNLFALYEKAKDKLTEQALQVIQNTNDDELEDRTIIKRLVYASSEELMFKRSLKALYSKGFRIFFVSNFYQKLWCNNQKMI